MFDCVLSFRAHLARVEQVLIFSSKLRSKSWHFQFPFLVVSAAFEKPKNGKHRRLALNLDMDSSYRRDTTSQGIEIPV